MTGTIICFAVVNIAVVLYCTARCNRVEKLMHMVSGVFEEQNKLNAAQSELNEAFVERIYGRREEEAGKTEGDKG